MFFKKSFEGQSFGCIPKLPCVQDTIFISRLKENNSINSWQVRKNQPNVSPQSSTMDFKCAGPSEWSSGLKHEAPTFLSFQINFIMKQSIVSPKGSKGRVGFINFFLSLRVGVNVSI